MVEYGHEEKLSDEEIKRLIAIHRKAKDKKTAVRINSVILWSKGWEYKKIHIVLDNAKYNHGKLFKEHIRRLKREKGMEIELIYLPTCSPNLNLIERPWKYAKKKVVGIYYDRFHKFKEAVENFFEKEVKEESCKADLRSFIGTSFQIIKG